MRIAIFDHVIAPTVPAGSCLLRILSGLCEKHEFTVFAVEFENPCPDRIVWVRIPSPRRPHVLLFIVYLLLAPIYYWGHRVRRGVRFDLLQSIESNFWFADIAYAHACLSSYLRNQWPNCKPAGIRRCLHWFHYSTGAVLEGWIYPRARLIVVPSRGLMGELKEAFPRTSTEIKVVNNCVDLERMRCPVGFDRQAFRQSLGIGPESIVLVFVALGFFERKGLPLLLEAMGQLRKPHLKLLVVGGEGDLVSLYRKRVKRLSLEDQVAFTGSQGDVRPYLWSAEAFVLPSLWEGFPLVALEAAAAGLPLLATPVHGVEELMRDGENGILLEPSAEGVAQGISRFVALPQEARKAMGVQAQRDVRRYAPENFVAAWSAIYSAFAAGRPESL